ncbi:MAG: hypothetical protein ACTHYM_03510 [Actinomycetaceae bacterium]
MTTGTVDAELLVAAGAADARAAQAAVWRQQLADLRDALAAMDGGLRDAAPASWRGLAAQTARERLAELADELTAVSALVGAAATEMLTAQVRYRQRADELRAAGTGLVTGAPWLPTVA